MMQQFQHLLSQRREAEQLGAVVFRASSAESLRVPRPHCRRLHPHRDDPHHAP
jgi:hypothetical protein